MKHTAQKLIALSICTLFCLGCGAYNNAQVLSRETLAQVVEYEVSLRNMTRLLQQYYKKQLTDRLKSFKVLEETSLGAIQFQTAEDAVDLTLLRGFEAKQFRDFILSVQEKKKAQREGFRRLLNKVVAAQQKALNDLRFEEKHMQNVRTKLELLQVEPTLEDRVTQLKPFLESTFKEYEEWQKRDTSEELKNTGGS